MAIDDAVIMLDLSSGTEYKTPESVASVEADGFSVLGGLPLLYFEPFPEYSFLGMYDVHEFLPLEVPL